MAASKFAIASDARLAGDARQTRFVLDLDKAIQFRAFALADPYRVVVDIPQVDFRLAGRHRQRRARAGQGLPIWPGHARRLADRVRSDRPGRIANSYVLDAANGQPPRLVLELEEVDRTTFVQSLAAESRPELKPAIADAADATGAAEAPAAPKPAVPADLRPVIVIDPGHGGIDNGTQAGGRKRKELVLGFGLALRDRIERAVNIASS